MSMYLIQSQTVSSPVSAITFSNIPQNFTHLQIRSTCKTTRDYSGNNVDWFVMQANGYSSGIAHYFGTDGATAYSATVGAGSCYLGSIHSSSTFVTNGTYMYSPVIVDIFNYTDTSKYKPAKCFSLVESNSSTYPYSRGVTQTSATYLTTQAINTLTFTNFVQWAAGSTFDLYGITSSTATGA